MQHEHRQRTDGTGWTPIRGKKEAERTKGLLRTHRGVPLLVTQWVAHDLGRCLNATESPVPWLSDKTQGKPELMRTPCIKIRFSLFGKASAGAAFQVMEDIITRDTVLPSKNDRF